MGELCLNFLGDLEVIRDGRVLALPPSRKTRALLAYLALQPRSFSREHLCDLLWEIPDDPRGSLRWSLSKLRRLVDEPDRPRIVADRLAVRFDSGHADIDVVDLLRLAERPPDQASTEELEAAAGRYRGAFLEGLDLSGFHDFHSWCLAERERAARAQALIRAALIERLRENPERALPHARALVRLLPYDEAVRAELIRLLKILNRPDEARQQFLLGMRMLKEAGVVPTGELHRVMREQPVHSAAHSVAAQVDRADGTWSPASYPNAAQPALVGRDRELERLSAAFLRARAGEGARFVLLTGMPGIGKSRLLRAVAEIARDVDALILQASAIESDTIRPFALWIDAFRRDTASGRETVFGSVDHDNRARLFEALSDRVAREGAVRPVVLLFDDLQWCDESSAAALHYVARMNRGLPLFGVLAARDVDLRDNGAVQPALRGLRHDGLLEELRLGPLSEDDIRRLIVEQAPEADSRRLGLQCGGNPLLAIELAHAESVGDRGGSLEELVRERLARFDVEEGEVLRWAAVLAPRIDMELLVRAADVDADLVGSVFDAAERLGLLRSSEEGIRFSHDLVARSVYADVPPARCRVMHRRVAALLQEDTAQDLEHAAELAHHALQSGTPDLAGQAMVCAGRLCLRFFANDDALMLARKGLALVAQLPGTRRICLTLELHDVMLSAAPLKDWEATAQELVGLAEQALEHGALAHARLGYQLASQVRWAHGQWAGAHEETLQAERVTRGADDRDHVVAMAETAKCLAMLERDLDQARSMAAQARHLAERQSIHYHAIPMALGLLHFHDNRLDEAEDCFKEARTHCKAVGDRLCEFQANEYLMMIAVERGRYALAYEHCVAMRSIGDKLREGSEAPFARAAEALCRYALDAGSLSLTTALEPLRAADARFRLAYILTRAALLDLKNERLESAMTHALEALDHARVLERPTEQVLAHYVLARANAALGHADSHGAHLTAMADFNGASVARWARMRIADQMPGEAEGDA